MTEAERLWHQVVDAEIVAKDAQGDLKASYERTLEAHAAHLQTLIRYRAYLDARLAEHDDRSS